MQSFSMYVMLKRVTSFSTKLLKHLVKSRLASNRIFTNFLCASSLFWSSLSYSHKNSAKAIRRSAKLSSSEIGTKTLKIMVEMVIKVLLHIFLLWQPHSTNQFSCIIIEDREHLLSLLLNPMQVYCMSMGSIYQNYTHADETIHNSAMLCLMYVAQGNSIHWNYEYKLLITE